MHGRWRACHEIGEQIRIYVNVEHATRYKDEYCRDVSAGLLACLFTISKHSHPKYEEIVYDDDNGPTKSTTNVGSLFGNIGIYRKFSASSEKQANNINHSDNNSNL